MIISTKKGTPKPELEKIVDKFEKQGLDVTLITGKAHNGFGLVGDTTKTRGSTTSPACLRPISAQTACSTPQTRSSTAAA